MYQLHLCATLQIVGWVIWGCKNNSVIQQLHMCKIQKLTYTTRRSQSTHNFIKKRVSEHENWLILAKTPAVRYMSLSATTLRVPYPRSDMSSPSLRDGPPPVTTSFFNFFWYEALRCILEALIFQIFPGAPPPAKNAAQCNGSWDLKVELAASNFLYKSIA